MGKTFEMLSAAQRERAAGTEVVVGYVEPHGRPETEALLSGLETLPLLDVTYRGATLREFDLDAALARRPSLLLVDELAHTNAPGMRHPKRWQDVEELLAAGMNVWTTLNVQHIESLNDVIAQITGVAVKETLPDTVLERADEIELTDITPDKLMERLAAGKVYVPAQAERALKNFFQKGNLLRFASCRCARRRVGCNRMSMIARQERAAVAPWLTSERVLVCVGPSPTSCANCSHDEAAGAIVGRRMAGRRCRYGRTKVRVRAQIKELTARNLRMAEQLARKHRRWLAAMLREVLLDFARSRNVTKIVAGKTAQPRWKQLVRRYRRRSVAESKRRHRHLRCFRRRRNSQAGDRDSAAARHSLGTNT